MLKNFFYIKLNPLSEKILSFWEKELKSSLDSHLIELKKNIEIQEIYNSKFSKLLEEMKIFDSEDSKDEENNEENQENNDNSSQNENQQDSEQEKKEQQQDQNGIDGEYDLSDFQMDEQLIDTDSEKESTEKVFQKKKQNN